ncbi:MAG: sulfatase [Proteobacteria bacterium]|nr:MAG: sulfatase [Pseudomonadota bacterium]
MRHNNRRHLSTTLLLCALATLTLSLSPASPAEAEPRKLPNGETIKACLQKGPTEMGCVPGGPFLRGSDDGPRSTRPQATVHLQTFYMDKYEVTVQAYEACVKAKRCDRQRTWYKDYSRPKQPKVGVSWYAAVKFCKAMGKHLPTEAEWEKAARGTDGRIFPWGNDPATCKRAVIMDKRGRRSCGVKKAIGKGPNKGRTFVVGTRAPTQYGLYDMAGNSWEWVYDWYSPYKRCGEACLGVNPKGPCNGNKTCRGHTLKIIRGGSWYWPARYARTFYRRTHEPSNTKPYHHFGFRCAASVEEAKALAAKALATKAR